MFGNVSWRTRERVSCHLPLFSCSFSKEDDMETQTVRITVQGVDWILTIEVDYNQPTPFFEIVDVRKAKTLFNGD
jgi:hypothetical protein